MTQPVSRNSDIILALLVVAVAMMLLIPLPTFILDCLLTLNFSFAFMLLMVGLYMPNALTLLAFPALLLLTTLFRLALNVASTRLILSRGEAGQVIEAFGTFLIQGEIVVGVIIFTIITIVNFIVIARGSSRVSEVTARFVLDALPGKQLAIDSDMRAGVISAQEAAKKRDDLRKESQLYGSMDGAMKFVQGDAIAGFFIILTNIVGGIYLGVTSGMSFSEAVETYTMLTVGDGLVTQIPALLISICAGIVVTRVSSGEGDTLGSELSSQLFSSPPLLALTGIIVLFVGFLPGLPFIPFAAMGSLFGLSSYLVRRTQTLESQEFAGLIEGGSPRALGYRGGVEGGELQFEEPGIVIALEERSLYPLFQQRADAIGSWWGEFQVDFYEEVGFRLPEFRTIPLPSGAAGTYVVRVGGSSAESDSVPLDAILVEVCPRNAEALGVRILREAQHPMTGGDIFWALDSREHRAILSAAGIRYYDFFQYIGLNAALYLRNNPEECLNLTYVHGQLKQVENKFPGLLASAIDQDFLNVARMTKILQQLVRERVSIRDFRQILELLASYCATVGAALVQQGEFDLDEIVTYVRTVKSRQVLGPLLSKEGTLKVIILSPQAEEAFADLSVRRGGGFGSGDTVVRAIDSGFKEVFDPIRRGGIVPVVVLCRTEIRLGVQRYLSGSQSPLTVATFEELHPGIRTETAGVWSV